jgi:hypothetical protein
MADLLRNPRITSTTQHGFEAHLNFGARRASKAFGVLQDACASLAMHVCAKRSAVRQPWRFRTTRVTVIQSLRCARPEAASVGVPPPKSCLDDFLSLLRLKHSAFPLLTFGAKGQELSLMKWKLLLLGAVLAVAGCASNPYPTSEAAGFGFVTDLVPSPVQGLTQADSAHFYGATTTASAQIGPSN